MNLLSTIGRGIKGAGRGILSGIDNAAVGSLTGGGLMDAALGSNGQPFTPTDQQRKGLRGQYLMGIGSALQQGRPIAEGIQQYQQNAIGQIQAGQQAQYQNQQRGYRQTFLTEMQAATTDAEKMKVLSRWGAMFPKEVQEFGAMMKELRPPENENMGAPFVGEDGKMYQGMKKGDPRVIPGMQAPNDLKSTGDGTGAMYDSRTGLTSPFRMSVNGMPMMVRENKKTGQFFNATDMAAGPISQNPVLPYDKPSPPRTIQTAQGFFEQQADGSYAPIKTASGQPVMPYSAPVNTSGRDDAREDRSYQFQTGALERTEKPIAEALSRSSRLIETLNNGSPVALAAAIPEFLTVMAGGAGSGLRMTEAEMKRIVGGRSVWEDLTAAASRFSANPEQSPLTKSQVANIRKMAQAATSKLAAKQEAINEARQIVGTSTNIVEHRNAVNNMWMKFQQIDNGQPNKVYNPKTMRFENK